MAKKPKKNYVLNKKDDYGLFAVTVKEGTVINIEVEEGVFSQFLIKQIKGKQALIVTHCPKKMKITRDQL